ncbi:adenylate kinase 8-like isoform X2 [Chrysoperla carnea]|uniref:adenylate kinase 8-like isoform X2 n=1 Tax=Chrysoperla carnea TaxID=189513 RepID=UPI001D097338|nr:adenylate kinase 8-like isoform X2 [Chrysoperla carnea]
MLVDVSKRDIRIPVKFLPYLEKYNIYALFHEVARQLAVAQPVDHISYMHNILKHAAAKCNVRQIIMLAPPFLNMLNLAKQLAAEINVTIVTETQINEVFDPLLMNSTKPEIEVAKWIKKLISLNHKDCNQGWLILGYPETKQEALALQRNSVIPTHVLNFVPAFMAHIDEPNIPQEWDISMTGRDITELMRVCLDLTTFNNRLKYAITPRILIIGCPGSGQKTIAKALQEKLKIVHVNFQLILTRALRNNDPAFKEYQELKTDLNINPSKKSRLHMEILMKILLDQKCVEKGWVVTGFPNTLEDMKRLDKTDTPPNRIFFFDCPVEICLQRLKNKTSCESVNIQKKSQTYGQEAKDDMTVKENHINIDEISKYCGKTATHIRTDQSCTDVLNTVLALIMREAPISLEQRNPYEEYERLPCKEKSQDAISHTRDDCLFTLSNLDYDSSINSSSSSSPDSSNTTNTTSSSNSLGIENEEIY